MHMSFHYECFTKFVYLKMACSALSLFHSGLLTSFRVNLTTLGIRSELTIVVF